MKRRYRIIFTTLLFVAHPLSSHAADPHWLNIDKVIVVAQNDVPATSVPTSASHPAQDIPMGQGPEDKPNLLPEENAQKSDVDESLFGLPGGGYVHPFLSLDNEYTDNLFNVNDNKKSNLLTTITPGIWLAAPKLKQVPIAVVANNTSPGGLQMAIPDYKGFDRYNTYLLGSTDFKFYSEDSDLNDFGAHVEGLFKYNLRSGLSFRVVDRFTRGQDRFDAGNAFAADKLRQYNSNIALSDIDWKFSEKFQTKFEYSNFLLNYKDDIVNFLNRKDNTGSIYGIYNYSVKTALYMQYQYMDITYDSSTLRDNTQNYFYGGINWRSSLKTSVDFKAGYQKRDFKNDAVDEATKALSDSGSSGLALELALQYQIKEKTKLSLAVNRKIDESDSYTSYSKEVIGSVLRYQQQFSEKINGTLDLTYEHADYVQLLDNDRKDNRYVFRPAVQYIMRDWLMFELAYQFDTRNSSENIYDYNSNTILLSINTAL
jgi:polysaccharide biosynthesis protein VpsM